MDLEQKTEDLMVALAMINERFPEDKDPSSNMVGTFVLTTQAYFIKKGWDDVLELTSRELAERFIEAFTKEVPGE